MMAVQSSSMSLPADVNAEKSVLAAIILNNALLEQAISFLETADFYLHSHRRVFDAMVSLKDSGNPIDTVTIHALLAERKEVEHVGGVSYLASLIDGVPQASDIEYYCRIIKYKAREREAITLFNDSLSRLIDGDEEFEAIINRVQSKLQTLADNGNETRTLTGVYPTLNNFFSAAFEEPEQILYGIHRGEVANLSAVTNYGKSTLLLNTALRIAAGETLLPLTPVVQMPRRVLYIDSESPATRARADLLIMIRGISNRDTAKDNFIIVVDAAINGIPLNLSKPDHFNRITALAKTHHTDLVVVDTAASAFELQDENNNAEITRRVMNPLKQMARAVNCAVIFTHHIGKANETQTGEAAYRGRGASAFGALSRTVFTLERDVKKGPEYIVLSCAKIKGQSFEPVLMKLDHETRWFELCNEKPEAKRQPPTAQEIADFVAEQDEARTEDIKKHFAGRASARTISDRIADAERLRLIAKPNQQAPWRVCNNRDGHLIQPPQIAEKPRVSEGVQVRNFYRELHTAHSKSNGSSSAGFVPCPACRAAGLLHTYCDRCGEFLR